MKRREFIGLIGGAAVSWPRVARAQQAKSFRIGILNFENPEPLGAMLRADLRDLGYVEGQNAQFEVRTAEGDRGRLAGLAAELVGLGPDVIVAYPTPAAAALKEATRQIPVVLLGAGDPVGTGLVASLARPGGNITGTASATSEAGAKTLEVLRDMLPEVHRVAVLANANDPFTESFLEQIRLGAQAVRLQLRISMIGQPDELDAAFVSIKNDAADAVVVQPSLPRVRIAELAMRHRVPSIAPSGGFATAGGLAAYSGNQKEMARRTATIVDRILKGSKPADLPVEQPTTFELVINLRTAKAIGVAIPPALLSRADEVIE
ncbi:MAG TPA: ABC transporter substrate-binding protein [Bradyrhizobium sp.]|nr:ABC transporter substrate-binding protein [Bradyrhizobium sp.]